MGTKNALRFVDIESFFLLQADSGGAAVQYIPERGKQYQLGIVSWGKYCGHRDNPSVYTRVPLLRDWIEDVFREHY